MDMGFSQLEVLFEEAGLPRFELPDEIQDAYGGTLGFEEPLVFANFVATLDGVVAIPSLPKSNKLIAGGSAADRFVLGLLRACCDVVVIGAGTLRDSPGGTWTPEQGYPPAADAFAELRRRLGRPPDVEVAVISGSGRVDPAHPALAAGGIVLTTSAGAARLATDLPPESILDLGDTIEPNEAVAALKARGHTLILSEGGPHAIAPFLEARLVDELFLTISPLVAGRVGTDPRFALVEGADLVPGGPLDARLESLRRDRDHVFLRYRLDTTSRENPTADGTADEYD
jgi:riboflavin biosynthesis pyrimidine reductase